MGLFVQIMTYKFGSKIEDVEDRLNEFLELVRRHDEANGTPLLVRCSPQRYQRCSLLTHVTFSSTPSSLAKIDCTPSNSCNSEMSTSGRFADTHGFAGSEPHLTNNQRLVAWTECQRSYAQVGDEPISSDPLWGFSKLHSGSTRSQ